MGVALLVALAIPFALALAGQREPRWYPSVDYAQTELRVRDVGSADPPVTGLGGRIGVYGPDQGSHPGPISFWSLAGPYRLFGSTSWALQVATASLHLVAAGVALWLAHRRGGIGLLLGTGAVLLALAGAYGVQALTLPWNPYLPLLWWVVLLLAVWSVLCGDLPALTLAVLAGSFCLQTHISYAGLVAGLAVAGAAGAVWAGRRSREGDGRRWRSTTRWLALALGLGALLWLPPVAEQLTGSQGGNLAVIVEHFGDPADEVVGAAAATRLLAAGVNPWVLLRESVVDDKPFLGGPVLPGALLLAAWAASTLVAGWLRHARLLRLHLLLGVALVLSVVSLSRIFGPPWAYLALWTWGIGALLALAVTWTCCALVARCAPVRSRRAVSAVGAAGALALVLALAAALVVDAARTDAPEPEVSEGSAVIVRATIEALQAGRAPGDGRDGRYLVTWDDPFPVGDRGFTLFNELDRAGFEVGAPRFLRGAATRHRVLTPAAATAHIHLVSGSGVDAWASRAGYRRVAYEDPMTSGARRALEQLRERLDDELAALGRPELGELLGTNPQALRYHPDLPDDLVERADRLASLRPPVAVFVGRPPAGG